ncbi:hypothetical protein JXA40_11895, partial [bacterium]|nr:hypothetical protein [candidate division CSSED10-310 bacterium]
MQSKLILLGLMLTMLVPGMTAMTDTPEIASYISTSISEIVNPNEEIISVPAPLVPERDSRAVLYDNGPLVTHPGGGAGGADVSALQVSLSMNTLGFGAQFSYGNRMADDFEVTDASGWDITEIT